MTSSRTRIVRGVIRLSTHEFAARIDLCLSGLDRLVLGAVLHEAQIITARYLGTHHVFNFFMSFAHSHTESRRTLQRMGWLESAVIKLPT